MATVYWDFENGDDSTGNGTAGNPYKTLYKASTGASAGDAIRGAKSPDPVSLGSVTFTNKDKGLTLSSAKTKTIDNCNSAWTAATNVTTSTYSGYYKVGTASMQMSIAAGFTTGKVAYKDLGSSIDFSSYDSITFWFWASSFSVADIEIRLCSDANGDTAVDTLAIPSAQVASTPVPMVLDNGGALGSSIRSIAVYVTSDPGTKTLYIDNVSACNDFSLVSLVGKNVTGDKQWYGIQSIDETNVELDGITTTSANSTFPGYYGTSETTTGYYRNPFVSAPLAGSTQYHLSINASGNSSSSIDVSGGWDLGSETQTGETFVDVRNGVGYGLFVNNSFVDVSKFGFYRAWAGMYGTPINMSFSDIYCGNVGYGSYFSNSPRYCSFDRNLVCSATTGAYFGGGSAIIWSDCQFFGCSSNTMYFGGGSNEFHDCVFGWAGYWMIYMLGASNDNRFYGCTMKDSPYGMTINTDAGDTYLYDCMLEDLTTVLLLYGSVAQVIANNTTFDGTTLITSNAYYQTAANHRPCLRSDRHDQVADDFVTFFVGGEVKSNDTVRQTAEGASMQFSPTHSSIINEYVPLEQTVAEIAVEADVEQTVTIYARRDNTGLSMRFLLRGGQIAGVASDVSDEITAAVDTWEQLSLTFTPTEDGVVQIVGQAWGGSTYNGYFHNLGY